MPKSDDKPKAEKPIETAPAPRKDGRKTPEEWRDAKFPANKPKGGEVQQHPQLWKHSAADVLHGWSKHAHHFVKDPVLLTEGDYDAAIKAACEPQPEAAEVTDRKGEPIQVAGYVPHKAAATKFAAYANRS